MTRGPKRVDDDLVTASSREYEEKMELVFSSEPNWIVRNGSILILLVVLALMLLCFVIRLPQTAKGPVTIHVYPTSITFLSKAQGRVQLLRRDGEKIEQNSVAGYIENTAAFNDVIECAELLQKAKKISLTDSVVRLRFMPEWNLGELQPHYLQLLRSINQYNIFCRHESYSNQIEEARSQLKSYDSLVTELSLEEKLLLAEMQLSNAIWKRDSGLFYSKVISEAQYEASRLAALPYIRRYRNIKQTISNTQITISNLISKINSLVSERAQKEFEYITDISNSLFTLDYRMHEWKQKYLFIASLDGTLVLHGSLTSHQNVNVGEPIITIVPEHQEIMGKVTVPTLGAGKISSGQEVLISLDDYPQAEYGRIRGLVRTSPTMQKDGQYNLFVDISENRLLTNYGKEVPPKEGMKGSASIITKDTKLIDHLFKQLREALRAY